MCFQVFDILNTWTSDSSVYTPSNLPQCVDLLLAFTTTKRSASLFWIENCLCSFTRKSKFILLASMDLICLQIKILSIFVHVINWILTQNSSFTTIRMGRHQMETPRNHCAFHGLKWRWHSFLFTFGVRCKARNHPSHLWYARIAVMRMLRFMPSNAIIDTNKCKPPPNTVVYFPSWNAEFITGLTRQNFILHQANLISYFYFNFIVYNCSLSICLKLKKKRTTKRQVAVCFIDSQAVDFEFQNKRKKKQEHSELESIAYTQWICAIWFWREKINNRSSIKLIHQKQVREFFIPFSIWMAYFCFISSSKFREKKKSTRIFMEKKLQALAIQYISYIQNRFQSNLLLIVSRRQKKNKEATEKTTTYFSICFLFICVFLFMNFQFSTLKTSTT